MSKHRGSHRRQSRRHQDVTRGYDEWAQENTPQQPEPKKHGLRAKVQAKTGNSVHRSRESQTVTRIVDLGSTALLTGVTVLGSYAISRIDSESDWAPLVRAAASGMPIPTLLTVGTTLIAEKLGASSGVARGAGAAFGVTGVAVETAIKTPDSDEPYTNEIQHDATEAGLSAIGGIGAVVVASAIMAHGWKNRR